MHLLVPLLLAVMPQGATGAPPIKACAVLTKEVLAQTTPLEKQGFDLVMRVPPDEDVFGTRGSACHYGTVTLQIDPFLPATVERARATSKTPYTPVAGVGDSAYFHDNRGTYAELFVIFGGSRVLTIQMSVPMGKTAAALQPNVIALAKAVLPKLK